MNLQHKASECFECVFNSLPLSFQTPQPLQNNAVFKVTSDQLQVLIPFPLDSEENIQKNVDFLCCVSGVRIQRDQLKTSAKTLNAILLFQIDLEYICIVSDLGILLTFSKPLNTAF